jgi:ssDNA-binding Zn-finger/Zn-ribbon topoisomerase 1
MSQQQNSSEDSPRRCPRCGGRMIKHSGSAFYWHADYNHPSCEITNLVDPPRIIDAASDKQPDESPPKTEKDDSSHGKQRKK